MKDVLPYVGLVALLLAVVNTIYQYRKDTQGDWKARFKELSDKLENAVSRLIVVETKAEIFFRGLSVSSAQALHSPHTKELDRLLEKFQKDLIEDESELQELERLLKEVTRSDPDNLRRKFAQDILTLIEVRYKIGGELIRSLENEDKRFASDIRNLSRRLEH